MTAPLFDLPPKLTERQEAVYAIVGSTLPSLNGITAFVAGTYLHELKDCRWCRLGGGWGSCDNAERGGREVLEALRKKGLVRRDRHHVYTRTDTPQPSSQGDFPEGY